MKSVLEKLADYSIDKILKDALESKRETPSLWGHTGESPLETYKRLSNPKLERLRQRYYRKTLLGLAELVPAAIGGAAASLPVYAVTGSPELSSLAFGAGMLGAGSKFENKFRTHAARKADVYAAKRMHPLDVAASIARTHGRMQAHAIENLLDKNKLREYREAGVFPRIGNQLLVASARDFKMPKDKTVARKDKFSSKLYNTPFIPPLWSRIDALATIARKRGVSQKALMEPVEEEWERLRGPQNRLLDEILRSK